MESLEGTALPWDAPLRQYSRHSIDIEVARATEHPANDFLKTHGVILRLLS